MQLTIGILALQGAFIEHKNMLESVSNELDTPIQVKFIRSRPDLAELDGLIIPGGESTTMEVCLRKADLLEPLQEWSRLNKPMFGTCAGLILLSNNIAQREDYIVGGLDITVQRNYYGHQIDSFRTNDIQVTEVEAVKTCSGIFIRAPAILSIDSSDTKVLASLDGNPVAVQKGSLFGLSFHPELTSDTQWHLRFIKEILENK